MNEHERTGRENRDRVNQALETIVQAVVGEDLDSFRHSVEQLDSDLSRKIESVRKEAGSRLDDSRDELAARVDELGRRLAAVESSQQEALADLEERTERIVGKLTEQLQTTEAQAESRTEAARAALEGQLAEADRSYKENLDALARNLATVQLGLQQQMETSERLSAVLNNLGSIFSQQTSAATAAAAEAEISEVDDKKELESVLDKVFPAGS